MRNTPASRAKAARADRRCVIDFIPRISSSCVRACGRAGERAGAVPAAAAEPGFREEPASHQQVEGLFGQLADTLNEIDFHKGRAPESAMRKLRRLFLRTGLTEQEVRLLRGVLSDAQRMARLASPGREEV